MSTALTLLGGVLGIFTNTAGFLNGTVHWLSSTFMPPQLQTWFLGTIGAPGQTWNPGSVYENVFRAVQGPALLITAVACAARVLRVTLDHRVPAGHVVIDVLPRFLIAVAFIGLPGTSVSVGYILITFAVNASIVVTTLLFSLLMQASLLHGATAGEGWFDHLSQVITSAGSDLVVVIIGAIPLLVLLLYAMFLMVARTVMLGFCITTAPLCLATAVFNLNNRFVQWWVDLFCGVLLTPIVLSVSISLSITIAANLVSAPPVGPMLAFVVICGGLWFSAKMVHHLTWRHFSHGGALAGFAAGVSTMLGPLHKVGSAGFMAEALGANREGSNSAINTMKRIGVAAQGLDPAAAGGRLLLPGGARAVSLATGANIVATGGAPNVASALSPRGRLAVVGAEALFSQQAFNAFARGQSKLIGSVTRDQPYGALPTADRARLAWERTPARTQTEFADDFLSHWLGSVDAGRGVTEDAQSAPALIADGEL